MTKIAFILVLVTIIFGTFRKVYSDGPQLGESKVLDNEQPENDDGRAGYMPNGVSKIPMNIPRTTPLSNALLMPQQYNLVECYACQDCGKTSIRSFLKVCPFTPDPEKQGRCVVYTEKYKNMRKSITIRGCASERGTCLDIRRAHSSQGDHVKLSNCYECVGDKCNGAATNMLDITISFITLAVLPIVGKCTLS